MFIRRSHFVSICLLALAASIALTEYVMYSPVISNPSDEDALFADDDSQPQKEDNEFGIIEDSIEADEADSSESQNQETKNELQNEDSVESKSQDSSKVCVPPEDEKGTSIKSEEVVDSVMAKEETSVKVTVSKGDTITSLLKDIGCNKTEIHDMSKALSKVFNIKNFKIGQEITVNKHTESGGLHLDGIEFKPDMHYKIVVSKEKSGKFIAKKIDTVVKKITRIVSGKMSPKNPMGTIIQCGVKKSIAVEALKVLNQVINIKSSKEPVNFEFLYADCYDEDGNVCCNPELVYASALVRGQIFRIYKFQQNSKAEYVDANGIPLNSTTKSKSMLARPLSYMKITSAYGSRLHPIYGVSKRHTGVDLKASFGAPIYAPADGRVAKACYYSGYGKYIKIAHSGSIDTAYGHLSKISVRPGQFVKRGQVIGHVGLTGTTTGVHLHYEVMQNGRFINPLKLIKQDPKAQRLTGNMLTKFNQFKKKVNLQIVGLTPSSNKRVSKIKKYT